MVRIKVCCIASRAEARMAIEAGASAIGLVSEMPSGPGPIPEARIREITAIVPPGVETFLLTSRQEASEILRQQRFTRTSTLQLVDAVAPADLATLRDRLPGIRLVQVIHVRDADSVDEALRVAPLVDALLLDSGNPTLAVKELGGTGRVHDWNTSREIVERVDRPVYLAGGLTPDNVAGAIRTVRPFGVDLCSGIRADGALDGGKLAAFVRAVRG